MPELLPSRQGLLHLQRNPQHQHLFSSLSLPAHQGQNAPDPVPPVLPPAVRTGTGLQSSLPSPTFITDQHSPPALSTSNEASVRLSHLLIWRDGTGGGGSQCCDQVRYQVRQDGHRGGRGGQDGGDALLSHRHPLGQHTWSPQRAHCRRRDRHRQIGLRN